MPATGAAHAVGLVAHHALRDLRILDAESAPEAAAHFAVFDLDALEALHPVDQSARLLAVHAELAAPRTGVVVGDGAGKARRRLAQGGACRPGTASARSSAGRALRRARASDDRWERGADSAA